MSPVAVIGAGVVGAAIAWRLAREGREVVLFDPDPGGIASRGSFAWLNAASVTGDAHYARLRMRALGLWRGIARAHPDCPATFPGMLLWEVGRGELEALARTLSTLGHRAEIVERAAIERLEPGLAAVPEAALWLPDEGRAEPRSIAAWFLRAARAAGAHLVESPVLSIGRAGGRWQVHSAMQVAVRDLVIAAGAATPALLAPLGITVRLRTEPGLLVRTAPARPTLTRLLASPGVHLWQAEDGSVLAGSDYGGTQHFDDPETDARAIVTRALALAPGLAGLRPATVAVTGRPMLPDDRPAIGRLAEGLAVAVTHSGMTLAPLIAGAIADAIAGRPADPDLSPYRPDRPVVGYAKEAP